MNKLYLIALFCLLATLGTEGFVQRGKTSPRRPAQEAVAAVSQTTTQEEDADGSDSVKGFERPQEPDNSGSLGVPSSEAEAAAEEESHPAPEPYSFKYSADTDDGARSEREETGDKDGKITGFYMLNMADGSQRRVNYVADKGGFRATITTNEVGTESKNPADVTIDSSAPEVVYPEGPSTSSGSSSEGSSSGSRSTSSGSRSTSVSTGSVKNTIDTTDDSSSDEDDFGSASSASAGNAKGASLPQAPVSRRPIQTESQTEDSEPEEAEPAPAPAPAPRPAPRPAPQQPTKTARRPAAVVPRPQAPRPAPRPAPQQPTKTAPRPQPVSRPAPQQPTKTAPRPRPQPRPQPIARPAPAPRPAPQQPTKTASRPAAVAPRPQAPRPAPRPAPQPTKGGSGQRSQAVAPRPAPVQRRPAPRPAPAPQPTSQETNTDDEDSFGNETNEQSADSSNSQYMVFPLNGINKPEIANLINNRRPIVSANRNSGLWLNENQLRNLLAVSRYRS